MAQFPRDGLPEAEARVHPRFDALTQCEACERWFEAAEPRLWVGWSGASITCVHCFFSAHAAALLDDTIAADEREDTLEFLAEKDDESGRSIGGIAGYRQAFVPDHDQARCPWAAVGCLLCDPRDLAPEDGHGDR